MTPPASPLSASLDAEALRDAREEAQRIAAEAEQTEQYIRASGRQPSPAQLRSIQARRNILLALSLLQTQTSQPNP